MGRLDGTLREYANALNAYRRQIEAVAPGITTRKDYCIKLTGTYSDAELNFSASLDNSEIFDPSRIEYYYHALVLEKAINAAESRENVFGCSHRRRGWINTEIPLDGSGDLKVVMGTNFGYGHSSYFTSSLSYMGISIINEMLIVYYSGLDEREYLQVTNVYEVAEKSYEACFNQSAAYKVEFEELGSVAFVKKYILKPVVELSRLFYMVSNSKVFFQVTSASKLNALLSGQDYIWLSESDCLDREDFSLSSNESDAVRRVAETVCLGEKDWDAPGYKKEVAEDARACFEIDDERPLVPQVAKIDLARNMLTTLLESAANGRSSKEKITHIVDKVLPAPDDCRILNLEGYGLHRYRTTKADLVLSALPKLTKLSNKGNFGNDIADAIESLSYTCKRISEQDREYIESRIDPRRSFLLAELDGKSTSLEDLKAKIEDAESRKSIQVDFLEWMERKKAELERDCGNLRSSLIELDRQKRFLMGYIIREKNR